MWRGPYAAEWISTAQKFSQENIVAVVVFMTSDLHIHELMFTEQWTGFTLSIYHFYQIFSKVQCVAEVSLLSEIH